jgi:hypothetical protein
MFVETILERACGVKGESSAIFRAALDVKKI